MGLFSFSNYIINKENLISNVKFIKKQLNKNTKFCAVVKANAYGVGQNIVSKIISEYVDCFAVANLEEGVLLRESGETKNIISLGAINFDYLSVYSNKIIAPPVSTNQEMIKLSSEAKSPILVEFGLNTGMNRIGFSSLNEIDEAIAIKNKNSNICLWGAFSHLATKENDVGFMYSQKRKFDSLTKVFSKNVVLHLSNTSASIYRKDFNYDMVRVGFGLYGANSFSGKLKSVVSIESKVVLIQDVDAGLSVGYDRTFFTNKKSKVAIIPLGYFDGINRRLSNTGFVLINGKYCPIVGRICMDAMMVDVTNLNQVQVGDKVTIIGTDGNKEITISDYAKWAGTSEYEIFSRLNTARMNVVIN